MEFKDLTNKQRQQVRNRLRSLYSSEEIKSFDSEVYDDTIVANAFGNYEPGLTPALNTITQGTGLDNAIGRKYWIRELNIRGKFRFLPSATDATQPTIRMILYVDRFTNGTGSGGTGGLATLLQDTSSTANRILAFQNLSNSDRFDVLTDRTYVLRPTANVASTEQADYTQQFSHYLKLDSRCYECILPPSSSIPTNFSIRLGVISTSSSVKLDYTYRIRFSG